MPNTTAHQPTATISLVKLPRITYVKAYVHTCTRMVTSGVGPAISYKHPQRGCPAGAPRRPPPQTPRSRADRAGRPVLGGVGGGSHRPMPASPRDRSAQGGRWG